MMSDVNKLDNKQCPFDPDQYQYKKTIDVEVDNVAPDGSFPWALIQVYIGKLVRRNGWDALVEYIKLIPGSTGNNDLPQIEITDKKGTASWQPTQEDMMACDWGLVKPEIKPKPEDCMLSFDLEVGTDQYGNGTLQDWGYLTNGGDLGGGESPFGVLTGLQGTLDIGKVLTFILYENTIGIFNSMILQVDTQNQPDLYSKNLEVTVDGSTYNLGSSSDHATFFVYASDSAKQLGDLLKQNVGNTLHFCFNWK
ncbi:DUF2829 domain-containing protein [Xenorhabdus khoisanae]|uniref:DUF2829 domain-containing protein n=1 Tax=Xenorhabdus khoisanae TaxID=880157 RepID=UPI002359EF77|nr:DUF2829 domain-containing protein [Xenorhabdus khoisanae]MDC9614206.1 DUF2829 domain-containing protein [Xenorhabdus khoisanae]